jgi:uncharacterized protein YdhG (YjbR/CyaY superfamily)
VVSSKAATVAEYLAELPADRRAEIAKVRDLVNRALPNGYVERMSWGMISWEVPIELSGPTYNGKPLLYAALAAQKNANSLYLSVFMSKERTERLKIGFADAGKKLSMGKGCVRFKRADDLALESIRADIASATPEQYIQLHRKARGSGAF